MSYKLKISKRFKDFWQPVRGLWTLAHPCLHLITQMRVRNATPVKRVIDILAAVYAKITMGQSSGKIDELKDLTLKGVVSQNKELGRGAYGVVYVVKYGKVYCAAKKLHPILTESVSTPDHKQEIQDKFIHECYCGRSINHPNIVRFLGIYYPSKNSLPDMIFELMDKSLTSFVKDNKSNIVFETKVSILYDVSVGLSYLHNHKPVILHRDLSPHNIMLTRDLVAKIGDLGVARIVQADSEETKSKLTTNPGTLDFMPPEASTEEPVYSTPIDVFLLVVLLCIC